MGYYNAGHYERLRLIAHLQEGGFSLATIQETLDHWTESHSLGHLLDVSHIALGLVRKPIRMSLEEFARRFAGVEITHKDIQRVVQIGLDELDGSELVMSQPGHLNRRIGSPAIRTELWVRRGQGSRRPVAARVLLCLARVK